MLKRDFERTQTPQAILNNERGIIPIIGIAIFLGLIVVILIVVVSGLDGVYQRQTGLSMFAADAGIHELRAGIEAKKKQIINFINGETGEAENGSPEEQIAHGSPQTADERMADIERRLNSSPK